MILLVYECATSIEYEEKGLALETIIIISRCIFEGHKEVLGESISNPVMCFIQFMASYIEEIGINTVSSGRQLNLQIDWWWTSNEP